MADYPAHGAPNWDVPLKAYLDEREGVVQAAAAAEAEAASIPLAQKGAANGVAPLGAGSRVAEANLPANLAASALSATYASQGVSARQTIGDGANPNASTTEHVKLLVTANRTNPDKVIEQHFVGFSFYSGTPGGGVGTLQGGSCESYAFANTANMGTVLGFEGVGRADGDAGRTITTIIGSQGTALAQGNVVVGTLVGIRARGVAGSGSPTVNEARSLDIQEPTIGTTRRALYGIGTHRFRKGTPTNTVEVSGSSDTLQWAFGASTLTGYASDGSSARIVLDPTDGATQRLNLTYFNNGVKGLVIDNINSSGTGNAVEYKVAGTSKFVMDSAGKITKINGVSVTHTAGAGSPEGVVTAPVGSVYQRTDGGAATCLYVKETGAGNTGWVAK